jgi:outer membrane protein
MKGISLWLGLTILQIERGGELMHKIVAVTFLVVSLLLVSGGAQAADLKVGVVNTADILEKSAEVKKIKENARRKIQELGQDLEKQGQDLGKKVADFEKQGPTMKEAARKSQQKELNRMTGEYRQKRAEAEKQFAAFEEKEVAPIYTKLEQAIKATAQEEKLDLVVLKTAAPFFTDKLDITEKVRKKFGP